MKFSRFSAVAMTTAFLLASMAFPRGTLRADEAAGESEASTPPIDIQGCWKGGVSNDAFGNTSITFDLDQNGRRIHKGSNVVASACAVGCGSQVRFGDTAPIMALIGGAVTSTGFTFHGSLTAQVAHQFFLGNHARACRIKGEGMLQSDGSFAGSYRYQGKCAKQGSGGGDFSNATRSCN
jgi:hypothetical protein